MSRARTGMRPGEVMRLRTGDIDRSKTIWVYKPASHKTQDKGFSRAIPIGPKAQAILVEWIKDKNRQGYKMVNSIKRLDDMKHFMRGKVEPWNCRAGQNNVIIRVDGTLAPCFPMYSATYDWGVIEKHKFAVPQLNEMKKECQTHCFSTLNHNLGYCYNDTRVVKWVMKQAAHRFQGVSGSFDD